jgi:putative iron-regulated protein
VLNAIAATSFTLSGRTIDATAIMPELLRDTLHEAGGAEANVATGYHAIEFLLWGQDLNDHGAGAGSRPATDFAPGAACTGGNCDRRAADLRAATDPLVADLRETAGALAPSGAARAAVATDPASGLSAMLKGMGSLTYGELAGERIRIGLMLNDPEEEQDCFSDTTHNSHFFNGLGIRNVYLGRYVRLDGTEVAGPSLAERVAARDPALDAVLRGKLETSTTPGRCSSKGHAAPRRHCPDRRAGGPRRPGRAAGRAAPAHPAPHRRGGRARGHRYRAARRPRRTSAL